MTPVQLKTLDFVRSFKEQWGYAPSFREIGDAFAISHVAAMYRVETLVAAGKLRSTHGKARSLELIDDVDLTTVSVADLRAELARRGEVPGALSVPERRVMGRRAVTCAADCCDIAVRVGHLMCRHHWFQVPFALREAIKTAHALARETGETGDADRFGELVLEARELVAGRREAA